MKLPPIKINLFLNLISNFYKQQILLDRFSLKNRPNIKNFSSVFLKTILKNVFNRFVSRLICLLNDISLSPVQ